MRSRPWSAAEVLPMFMTDNHVAESDHIGVDSLEIIQGYIIPYPPGVPLAVPGDVFTRQVRDEIARLRRAGVEVFFINN
jgi:arginine/lysine/ornithine decarboxylase